MDPRPKSWLYTQVLARETKQLWVPLGEHAETPIVPKKRSSILACASPARALSRKPRQPASVQSASRAAPQDGRTPASPFLLEVAQKKGWPAVSYWMVLCPRSGDRLYQLMRSCQRAESPAPFPGCEVQRQIGIMNHPYWNVTKMIIRF